MNISKEQILSQGHAEIRVKVGGIIQRHKFLIVKEKTAFGEVPYLETKGSVTVSELARLSQELGLPVRSPLGTAFPPGKGTKDFAIAIKPGTL